MDIISEGKKVFELEIEYLSKAMNLLDEKFCEIIDIIYKCDGKVILTGIGKSGHIARKISSTLTSLGTPSLFLHPAEALHGDLGIVEKNDIVVTISNSGETSEIIKILPNIKLIGAKVIALTSNSESDLCKYADCAYIFPKSEEACHLNLAPTTSCTILLVLGDAIAIVLSKMHGFSEVHFGLFHSEGSIGKKLSLEVNDLMCKDDKNAVIGVKSTLVQVIAEMCRVPIGLVSIVDSQNKLVGVFSDGDIRRILSKNIDIYNCKIEEIMTSNPHTILDGKLAVAALSIIKAKKITALPVLNEKNVVIGTVSLHNIVEAGIY